MGTGTSTSLKYVKEKVDTLLNVDWAHHTNRTGDIKYSVADIKPLKKLGWVPKIDINEGLNNCFNTIKEK